MTDLENDPAWVVKVTLTTSVIATNQQEAIDQVSEVIHAEFGNDINMGDWGEMLPFDLTDITAEELVDF